MLLSPNASSAQTRAALKSHCGSSWAYGSTHRRGLPAGCSALRNLHLLLFPAPRLCHRAAFYLCARQRLPLPSIPFRCGGSAAPCRGAAAEPAVSGRGQPLPSLAHAQRRKWCLCQDAGNRWYGAACRILVLAKHQKRRKADRNLENAVLPSALGWEMAGVHRGFTACRGIPVLTLLEDRKKTLTK